MLLVSISLLLMTSGIAQEALSAQTTATGDVVVRCVHLLTCGGIIAQYRLRRRDTDANR